jgi:ATP-dependent Clp protease ATP-binding subunit ClpC
VLKNLGVDLAKVQAEVGKLIKRGPVLQSKAKLPQTPQAKRVIEYAIEESKFLNHNYVGTEHMVLGLLLEQEGVAAKVLMDLGLKLEAIRAETLKLVGTADVPKPSDSYRPSLYRRVKYWAIRMMR